MSPSDDDRHHPTMVLDPREIGAPAWEFAIAALERVNNWAVLALRLGTLALLQECTREMAKPEASPKLVDRARELVEALARMPWDL